MLDDDYETRFGQLIRSLDWDIELPPEWGDFFAERGKLGTRLEDDRRHQRMMVRVYGALWFTGPLPSLPRPDTPVGIYTRDFSRRGFGFLSSMQLFPEEIVRVVLPTFWVEVRIVRARRFTASCYLAGAELVSQHDPSPEAFARPELAGGLPV